jgi:putative transcription factor
MTQAMQTARMELKLSQKDVAQKINEKPSVLQDYESGKAIPNPQILSKLERTLGVKLRGMSPWFLLPPFDSRAYIITPGSDIGKKLEGPKKS